MLPLQLYIKINAMANVLIPTDFTQHSLQLAAQALESLNVSPVNIVLFHAFEQPQTEFGLLAPARPRPFANLVTEDLRQACKQFKDKHHQKVQKIYFRFLEGETAPLFRNFIDANEIDLIYCPENYMPVKVNKHSIDPRPLFKKAGVPVIKEAERRQYKVAYKTVPEVTPQVMEQLVIPAAN